MSRPLIIDSFAGGGGAFDYRPISESLCDLCGSLCCSQVRLRCRYRFARPTEAAPRLGDNVGCIRNWGCEYGNRRSRNAALVEGDKESNLPNWKASLRACCLLDLVDSYFDRLPHNQFLRNRPAKLNGRPTEFIQAIHGLVGGSRRALTIRVCIDHASNSSRHKRGPLSLRALWGTCLQMSAGQNSCGRESSTPNCCASFQTTTAQYRSSSSKTSSRKRSGIPKTLSTRSFAPVSERSTIRHESDFPNFGTILAGLPSLYRVARRCSTTLRASILRLRSGLSVEVVVAKLTRAEAYICELKCLPASLESQNEGAAV